MKQPWVYMCSPSRSPLPPPSPPAPSRSSLLNMQIENLAKIYPTLHLLKKIFKYISSFNFLTGPTSSSNNITKVLPLYIPQIPVLIL